MANNILNTKSLIEELNAVWIKHAGILDRTSESYKNVVNSAKLPSNYAKAIKEREQNTKALEKSEKKLLKAQKDAQRQRLSDLRLYAKREKAFDKYEKQLQREQQRLERTQGLYNKVQRGLNSVKKEYQDLAVRKELDGKLSKEQEIQLARLEAKLTKYNSALKKVDSNIGNYQRNVGNYKSGFDGLGNSITQLTREVPAFANSMQTGFMAISNNLPIFFDEISKTRKEVKNLRAEGVKTKGTMGKLAASFFSFQTLLSVGVTLLTLYGADLVDLAFGVGSAEKAQRELNKELAKSEAEAKQASKEITVLRDIVLDTTRSEKARAEALRTLNGLIPETTKFTLEQLDANNGVNKSNLEFITLTGLYVKAAMARAKADIFTRKAAELEIKQAEDSTKSIAQQVKWYDYLKFAVLDTNTAVTSSLENVGKQNKKTADQIKFFNDEAENQLALALELESALQGVGTSGGSGSEQTQDRIIGNSVKQIEKLGLALSKLNNIEISATIDIPKIADDFVIPIENNFKETFGSITNIAGQAFDIMGQFSDQYFNKQFTNLELEKENALLFAGESATAREEIERQYDEKKRKIQQRQAKAKKEQAIFDIIIDTAAAVASALGNPLLIASVASLGAAQLALVASQQIPQFWMGTEGTPGGQIMVNDDPLGVKGSNYKEVIKEPNGKLHFPTGKNVKMNVPKGSKVYSTYDQFMNSLDYQLSANNIMPIGQANMPPMIINQGLTREDLSDVMLSNGKQIVNAINGKESIYFNYDERGAQIRRKKDNKTTKIMNARYTGRGLNV